LLNRVLQADRIRNGTKSSDYPLFVVHGFDATFNEQTVARMTVALRKETSR